MTARRLPPIAALLALWVLVSPALAAACCLADACAALRAAPEASAAEPSAGEADSTATERASHCDPRATAEAASNSEPSERSAKAGDHASGTSANQPGRSIGAALQAISPNSCERPATWNEQAATAPHAQPTLQAAPAAAISLAAESLVHRLISRPHTAHGKPELAPPPLFTLHSALLI